MQDDSCKVSGVGFVTPPKEKIKDQPIEQKQDLKNGK